MMRTVALPLTLRRRVVDIFVQVGMFIKEKHVAAFDLHLCSYILTTIYPNINIGVFLTSFPLFVIFLHHQPILSLHNSIATSAVAPSKKSFNTTTTP